MENVSFLGMAMNILFVTQYDPSNPASGGPAFKVRAVSYHMACNGHAVTIVTAAAASTHHIPDQPHVSVDHPLIRVIRMRTLARYRSTTFNPAIWPVARREVPRAEVIHLFGFYDLMAPIMARGALGQGVPYVLEPMGMLIPIVRSLGKKRFYHKLIGSPLIQGASQVIATAPQEQEELIEAGVLANRVSVRRNGIDLEDFEKLPERGTLRRRFGIELKGKLILYLGLLSRKKNPDLLIRAFSTIAASDAHLLIAGPDVDECTGQLRGLIESLGLQSKVFLSGPLYDEDKLSALVDADIFVLPSQNENFGNVIAESIAVGTPVVITDKCGIAPYVRDKAGLVAPVSQAAISEAMSRLLHDAALHETFSAGCQDVARKLSWDRPVAELQDLYESLTKNS